MAWLFTKLDVQFYRMKLFRKINLSELVEDALQYRGKKDLSCHQFCLFQMEIKKKNSDSGKSDRERERESRGMYLHSRYALYLRMHYAPEIRLHLAARR